MTATLDQLDDMVLTPFPIRRRVLAIIGSTAFAKLPSDGHFVHAIVGYALGRYRPDAVVSGGAIGVDRIARVVSESFGYLPRHSRFHMPVATGTIHEFLPVNQQWKPEGFQQRNLWIAGSCTHLIAIRSAHSTTYGSGWTADRAEEMGVFVKRIMVPLTEPIEWPDW